MIRLICLLFLFSATALLTAQETLCPDSTYQRLLQEGQQYEKTDFQKALRRYNAARICQPEKAAEVDALIFNMFRTIEAQRDEARIQAEKARRSEGKAKLAQQKAEETLEKLETASRQIYNILISEIDELIFNVNFKPAFEKIKAAIPLVPNPFELEPCLLEIAYVYNESGHPGQALEALDLVYTGIRKLTPPKDRDRNPEMLRQEIKSLSPSWFDTLHTIRYALPEMIFVEGGAFWMGCDSLMGDSICDTPMFKGANPLHQVTLSGFFLAKTETTVWQFFLFCLSTGMEIEQFTGFSQPGNTPIVRVNWFQIAQYANWASDKMSWPNAYLFDSLGNFLSIDYGATPSFRMPTEAQWEYAARGGLKSIPTLYAGSNDIGEVAWYWENSAINGENQIHPVATKKPNELGLYDMSGNAFEWVQDWNGPYSEDPATNPSGPDSGEERVNRGGAFFNKEEICRVSYRNRRKPEAPHPIFGFRLARIP